MVAATNSDKVLFYFILHEEGLILYSDLQIL